MNSPVAPEPEGPNGSEWACSHCYDLVEVMVQLGWEPVLGRCRGVL